MVHLVRQDLSVAGLRKGLKHGDLGDEETTRSGLFMEQVRLFKEMFEGSDSVDGNGRRSNWLVRPRVRYLIWENVSGAFSSPGGKNSGKDFAAVIEELCKIKNKNAHIDVPKGGWQHAGCIVDRNASFSIAWRLHDAQHWNVPQRRKRIALLYDALGFTAGQILFDSELVGIPNGEEDIQIIEHSMGWGNPKEIPSFGKSLQWNTVESSEERKTAPSNPEGSTRGTSYTLKIRGGIERDSHGKSAGKGALIQEELSGTLGVSQDQTLFHDVCSMGHDERSARFTDDGSVDPLTASDYKQPTIVSYGFDQGATRDVGNLFLEETAKTIANGTCPGHHNGVVTDTMEWES